MRKNRQSLTDHLISSSTLTAPIPPDPPGFTVELLFRTEDGLLTATGVYLTSIILLYHLAQQPWDQTVYIGHLSRIVDKSFGTIILTNFDGPGTEMQTGHVILALYKGVFAMAEGRPGFYQLNAMVFVTGRHVGSVQIVKILSNVNKTMGLMASQDVNSSGNLTDTSGKIPDPDDDKYEISYHYDGRSVPAQEILTAVLDGLATAAQYSTSDACQWTTGVSVLGNTVVHVGQTFGQTLLCGQLMKLFYLVGGWITIRLKLFGEMDFSLMFEGREIAEGYILKLSATEQQNGIVGIASS
ncbi:hypothetical protein MMC28_009037 [Mycoblastus sanguinarius]|nr:hypothetical protein [Mycoblastus sanguinarius]